LLSLGLQAHRFKLVLHLFHAVSEISQLAGDSRDVLTVSHASSASYAEAEGATPRRHIGRRSRRLRLTRRIKASPANSDKSRSATRTVVSLGYTVESTFLDEPVGNS
jgi:hypothetical protein